MIQMMQRSTSSQLRIHQKLIVVQIYVERLYIAMQTIPNRTSVGKGVKLFYVARLICCCFRCRRQLFTVLVIRLKINNVAGIYTVDNGGHQTIFLHQNYLNVINSFTTRSAIIFLILSYRPQTPVSIKKHILLSTLVRILVQIVKIR